MLCAECNHPNPPGKLICENCRFKLYKAKLVIPISDGDVQTHYLYPKTYTLGRDKENDIVIPDVSVSRFHAQVVFKNGSFSIQDMNSKNGSLLNEQVFENNKLRKSDTIQLGNIIMRFFDDNASANTAVDPAETEERVQNDFLKFAKQHRTQITLDDVVSTLLDLLVSLIHADLAIIFECNHRGDFTFKMGRSPAGEAFAATKILTSARLFLDNAVAIQRTQVYCENHRAQLEKSETLSFSKWTRLAVPLISTKGFLAPTRKPKQNRVIGVCYFSRKEPGKPLSRRKKELLNALIMQLSLAHEANRHCRDTDDYAIARQIRQQIFPVNPQPIKQVDIAYTMQPCEDISGDYFDLLPISNTAIAVAIGDISGKGIQAALLSAAVRSAIRSQLDFCRSPKKILVDLNDLLVKGTAESIFLTLFFGILNTRTGQLKYINAGHPPPILLSKNGAIQELTSTTPPLGILEEMAEPAEAVQFATGDILLLYTDGIIESQNRSKEFYGRKRMKYLLESLVAEKKNGHKTSAFYLNRIEQDLALFKDGMKQTDDLTLLALQRKHVKTR